MKDCLERGRFCKVFLITVNIMYIIMGTIVMSMGFLIAHESHYLHGNYVRKNTPCLNTTSPHKYAEIEEMIEYAAVLYISMGILATLFPAVGIYGVVNRDKAALWVYVSCLLVFLVLGIFALVTVGTHLGRRDLCFAEIMGRSLLTLLQVSVWFISPITTVWLIMCGCFLAWTDTRTHWQRWQRFFFSIYRSTSTTTATKMLGL